MTALHQKFGTGSSGRGFCAVDLCLDEKTPVGCLSTIISSGFARISKRALGYARFRLARTGSRVPVKMMSAAVSRNTPERAVWYGSQGPQHGRSGRVRQNTRSRTARRPHVYLVSGLPARDPPKKNSLVLTAISGCIRNRLGGGVRPQGIQTHWRCSTFGVPVMSRLPLIENSCLRAGGRRLVHFRSR